MTNASYKRLEVC